MRPSFLLASVACLPSLLYAYTPVGRWAQAVTVNTGALFVYGGHTDPFNQIGYDGAAWNNDLLYLNLGQPWDPSSPPWNLIGGSNNLTSAAYGPGLAWHTLSTYADGQTLLFGGKAGPLSDVVLMDKNDSAVLLDVFNRFAPTLTNETNSWSGEPQRRMRHAAATVGGKVYLVGGQRADGSTNGFSDHYVFDPSGPSFTLLPTSGAPSDIYGHAALVLPDGRIIVLGGWQQSTGAFISFSQVWLFDPASNSWSMANVDPSTLPAGRLDFCAAVLPDGRILIHGGSNSIPGSGTTFSDGWILDTTQTPMKWESVAPLVALGARRNHFCVAVGSEVIVGFGYSSFKPADANLHIYDPSGSSFLSSWSPMTAPPTQTTVPPTVPTGGASGTNPGGAQSTGSAGVGNTSGAAGASGTGPGGSSGPTASRTSGGSSPTATGGSGSGNGGGSGGNGNGGGGNGGSGGNGVAGDAAAKRKTTAIVIGAIFGVLALVAGAGAAYWYARRRRLASENAFTALDGDEDGPGHGIPVISAHDYAEKGPRVLSAVPLFGFATRQRATRQGPRRDMLADEDRSFDTGSVWSFAPWRRSPSGHSRVSREPSNGSSWSWTSTGTSRSSSVRSALAMLGIGAGAAAAHRSSVRRLPSEKYGVDAYGDDVGLMSEPLADEGVQRPRGGAPGPSGYMYSDPFSDTNMADRDDVDVLHDAGMDSDPEDVRVVRHVPHPALRTALPPTADFVPMSPLIEQASRHSFSSSSQAHSSQQHTSTSARSHLTPDPMGTVSSGSHSHSAGPHSPRPSSILDSNYGGAVGVRRSDTWWRRLADSSLLPKRRHSDASARGAGSGFVPVDDFRDPNPVPHSTLHPITEGSQHTSPDSPRSSRHRGSSGEERAAGAGGLFGLSRGAIGKSMTSLQTANSETIERAGGMAIVQREGTYDSNWTTSPTQTDEFGYDFGFGHGAEGSSGSRRRPLVVRSNPSEISQAPTEGSLASTADRNGTPAPTDTPLGTTVAGHTPEASGGSAKNHGLRTNIPAPALPPSGPRSPGSVAQRVHAYERRASQNPPPLSPPIAIARPRPARQDSDGPRGGVRYGLAPRASLFVANPDNS